MAQASSLPSPAQRLQSYEEFALARMQEWKVPGVAVGIIKDDEVIYTRGFGQRDREQGLAMTPQTVFCIASCTKAYVAMGLAMLVDEGKLDWDVPLRNYLPEFQLSDSVASERVTTRDILSHRTGLPRHDLLAENTYFPLPELVKRLRHLELTKDLRAGWQYNNLLYATAGYLLETLSGQSWDAFIRQRIREPLGMNNTGFSLQEMRQAAEYAAPYRLEKGELQRTSYYSPETMTDAPAGSMASNVDDTLKWVRCLINGTKYGDGEQRLVSQAQYEQLIGPQMIVPRGELRSEAYPEESHYCYGLGWWTFTYRGHRVVQHSGGVPGFSLLTTFLPDDKLGIVTFTNREAYQVAVHSIFTFNLCDRVLGLDEMPWNERTRQSFDTAVERQKQQRKEEDAKQVKDAPPSHPLSAYVGQYEHPGYGAFTVSLDEQGLKGLYNNVEYRFTHFHYDVFQTELAYYEYRFKVSFATDLDGNVASLAAPLEPAANPIVFKRVAVKAAQE
ncbi:serine hydrolase [Ktedonosporobacter rubrisoli]|uniref:Serine hydrolase n=1 Tax=Ktedonosporobacter rubrisoli TaxID=2509675 RepID=A0A4P6JQE4_KTERU|nr:serine hydrolase [Ktedonosporobacter rubrisoli]QBD76986.1 serine hydrolase [Ktedonosporobacter rubrisoli]